MQRLELPRRHIEPDCDAPALRIEAAVGANIKAGRLRRQMSVAELATNARLSISKLGSYEAGQERIPPMVLVNITDALDMRISDAFGL